MADHFEMKDLLLVSSVSRASCISRTDHLPPYLMRILPEAWNVRLHDPELEGGSLFFLKGFKFKF